MNSTNKIPNRQAVSILSVCALLYIPLQWVAGRCPGSVSIFSAQHREMQENFLEEAATLRRQLLFQCAHRGVHDIYFKDSDVISPYLVTEVQAQPGCVMHRETLVTPQEDAPKLACSAVVVDEGMPNAWYSAHAWDSLETLEGKVVTVSSFDSQDKQFDFKLLQAPSCAHTDMASNLAAGSNAGSHAGSSFGEMR
jgi:hypothetical protein